MSTTSGVRRQAKTPPTKIRMMGRTDRRKELVPSSILECPTTRFQGSKRKLLPWLHYVLGGLNFKRAVDLMSGTGSVSYLLKRMGKQVFANDYLRFNYATAVAFIENSSTVLSDEDVEWLLTRHPEVPYRTFVADTFSGYYFTEEENGWVDQTASNIFAFSANAPVRRRYKRALAFHALVQACLMKRPFNLFHRRNLYLREADVERSFGNKTTWETPFESLFRRFASEARKYVFSNKIQNHAFNLDALDVQVSDADLVYIDPPYFAVDRERARSNYRLLYHFVEGLAQYNKWPSLIDGKHSLKLLKPYPFSTDALFTCPRSQVKAQLLDWLQRIVNSWPNAQIVISYKHPGLPGLGSLKRLLLKTGREVSVRKMAYRYALSHKNGVPNENIEVLLVGK